MRRSPRGSITRVAAALAGAAFVAALTAAPAMGADPAGDRVKVIVQFQDPPGRAERRLIREAGGTVNHTYTLIDGVAAEVPAKAIPGLRHNPRVVSVDIDGTVSAIEPVLQAQATGDFEYDNAWGVVHIGTKAVHDAGIKGAGVKVAIIDSGIDYIHDQPAANEPPVVDPEFLGNYKGGFDFLDPLDTQGNGPLDDNGHGTHVAGILAAEKNGYLVVGVAPQVDLYALKILDAAGNGLESDLVLALQWAVTHDIDVVNMSIGTQVENVALGTAVANAAAAGLLMVAASGNTVTITEIFNGCPVAYPARYPHVLSTTFTNQADALTGYSCTGPEVDFASPGDGIFSTVPVGTCLLCSPNGYSAQSGTSMASPHLAGTVALLLDAGIADAGTPGLFDDVRARLCATANVGYGVQTIFGSSPIPTSDPRYPRYFGCGVLDAAEAVLGVAPPPGNQPPVANDDTATVAEDGSTDVPVLANDTDPNNDPRTVSGVTNPPHGTASVNGNGTVHYVPDANYAGADGFDYTIGDGQGGTDTGHVSVTVTSVNDAPVAANDSATTAAGAPVSISVLANDSDVEGSALGIGTASDPPHGTTVANPDGTITYTPDAGYSGPDAFGYTASDGTAVSNVATVTVTVTATPPPPPPATVLHLGDLDRSSANAGRNSWVATVTIRVHDASDANVRSAVVTGTWSNGATGTGSCTTATNGTCSVKTGKLATSVASATFTVTGVAKTGTTYAAASNHEPDTGDTSTGTSITVNRPA
jgi:subtilisin